MTFDATVGGASANSYVTMLEANTYFNQRFDSGSAWTTATDAQKTGSILNACQALEDLDWVGNPYTNSQALNFPRNGVPTRTLGWGVWEDPTSIPQRVKDAQCEWAAAIIAGTYLLNPDPQDIGPITIGPIVVPIESGYTQIPPQVKRLLKHAYVEAEIGYNGRVSR